MERKQTLSSRHARTVGTLVALLIACASSAVHAGQISYVGIHPVSTNPDDGLCHIEVPHVHTYEPGPAEVAYRAYGDHYYFVGDPVAFGYDGDRHAYYGHHPIVIDIALGAEVDEDTELRVEYCYLNGPHYHSHAPPPTHSFVTDHEVHFYVDSYPRAYRRGKAALIKINAMFKPIAYVRPVFAHAMPAGYRGPVVEVRSKRSKRAKRNKRRPARKRRGRHAPVEIDVHVVGPAVEIAVPVIYVERHRHRRGHRHWRKHKHKHGRKHKRKHRHKHRYRH